MSVIVILYNYFQKVYIYMYQRRCKENSKPLALTVVDRTRILPYFRKPDFLKIPDYGMIFSAF
jgi:hypothetical protein